MLSFSGLPIDTKNFSTSLPISGCAGAKISIKAFLFRSGRQIIRNSVQAFIFRWGAKELELQYKHFFSGLESQIMKTFLVWRQRIETSVRAFHFHLLFGSR
jgi:hypothetical protein